VLCASTRPALLLDPHDKVNGPASIFDFCARPAAIFDESEKGEVSFRSIQRALRRIAENLTGDILSRDIEPGACRARPPFTCFFRPVAY